MIELPESRILGLQATQILCGRTITSVFNASQPHHFTWYTDDPLVYPALLTGRRCCGAQGYGAFVDLQWDDEVHLAVSDGVNVRYYDGNAEIPQKYQLLIGLDNDAFLVFTVAMYGGILAFSGGMDNSYWLGATSKTSPLDATFDASYFERLFSATPKNHSVKAFLATEQRIPGLGNGVLQDILFRAGIHPKRKLTSLSTPEIEKLYAAIKSVLSEMVAQSGRDTEKDLLGKSGGYRTVLSRNTYAEPCPVCEGGIVKEAYLGGAIYYCPYCQPMK